MKTKQKITKRTPISIKALDVKVRKTEHNLKVNLKTKTSEPKQRSLSINHRFIRVSEINLRLDKTIFGKIFTKTCYTFDAKFKNHSLSKRTYSKILKISCSKIFIAVALFSRISDAIVTINAISFPQSVNYCI